MLDYAWKAFQYHASQRMLAFNYLLLFMGALAVAYYKARESGTHVQAAFIAASGVIVALAFFILDFRNEALVNHARVALQSMEKLPPFLLLPDCKLATKGGERSFCKSHAFWLRAVELCLLALSLFALISLIPNGCYVRSH